jgi:hypothetical protein
VDLELWFIRLLRRAQVGGCELEGIEEKSCAAGVDVVGGDAGHYLSERLQDGVRAAGGEEGEGASASDAAVGLDDGAAGVVVVVAELLVAHARAAAAGVVGEDVVALVEVIGVVIVLHGWISHRSIPLVFLQSLPYKWVKSGLHAQLVCQTCG